MKKTNFSESNFDLWHLIGKVHHSLMRARQKELNQYHIPARQAYILRTIQTLGPKTTLSELAKKVERQVHVISRQTVKMENDGLIKRIKDTPKSNLLRLELTEKGLEIIKFSKRSKSIDTIFSYFSRDERQQFESALNLILAKLDENHLV
jgi:DNA-binding MarR family transcriptional regulator